MRVTWQNSTEKQERIHWRQSSGDHVSKLHLPNEFLRCFVRPTFHATSLKPIFSDLRFYPVSRRLAIHFDRFSVMRFSDSKSFKQFQSAPIKLNQFHSVLKFHRRSTPRGLLPNFCHRRAFAAIQPMLSAHVHAPPWGEEQATHKHTISFSALQQSHVSG